MGGGETLDDDDDKCYLFLLLSPIPIGLCENLNLPPYLEDHEMECNSCGPLLYLDDLKGNIVLCNLTAKQLKLLPPPDLETPLCKATFAGMILNPTTTKLSETSKKMSCVS